MPTPSCIVLICTDICQDIPSRLVLYQVLVTSATLASFLLCTQVHYADYIELHLSRHCSIYFVDTFPKHTCRVVGVKSTQLLNGLTQPQIHVMHADHTQSNLLSTPILINNDVIILTYADHTQR